MRILILLLIYLIVIEPSYAIVQKPSFQEFCPAQYYGKEYLPRNWCEPAKYPTHVKALFWSSIVLFYPAIVCYPLAISDTEWRRQQRSNKIRKEYNATLHYWKQREASFNTSLELCDSSKDKAACYMQVRNNEIQRNLTLEQNELLRGIGIDLVRTNHQLYNINSTLNGY